MNSAEQIRLQQQIKQGAEDLQMEIKDLYSWEKNIKEKERKDKENSQEITNQNKVRFSRKFFFKII